MKKLVTSVLGMYLMASRAAKYTVRIVPRLTIVLMLFYLIDPLFGYLSAIVLGNAMNNIQKSYATHDLSFGTIVQAQIALVALVGLFSQVFGGGAAKRNIISRWRWKLQRVMRRVFLRKRSSLDVARLRSAEFENLCDRINESQHAWFVFGELTILQFRVFSALAGVVTTALIIFQQHQILLGVIMLVSVIPEFVADVYLNNKWRELREANTLQNRKLSNYRNHFHSPTKLMEVKLFNLTNWLAERIENTYDPLEVSRFKHENMRTWISTCSTIPGICATGWCMWKIAEQGMNGAYLMGTVSMLIYSIRGLSNNFGNFLGILAEEHDLTRTAADVFEFLSLKPLMDTSNSTRTIELVTAPTIVFEGVSYRYPNSDKLVIKNLNLTIKPGEKIGIMGKNGAGKSTIISLLCRFDDPTEGRILIDGVDLKLIHPEQWFQKLSVLLQRYASYDFLVGESIAVSDVNVQADKQRIQEAAEFSNANEFIADLKNQYDTQIGVEFEGIELSGGQQQRLAISTRAFRQRHILLLDEPAAALDADSKEQLFSKLSKLPRMVTAIYVSHDLPTLRLAERVLVFNDGVLVEDGTHEELIGANGIYAGAFRKAIDMLTKQVESLKVISHVSAA